MIDLVTFLIPRITFFLLGSIIGSLIYIIYYILDMMTRTTSITYSLIRENLIKSKLIKLRFGFILSFLEFYAEFFIVSYPDIINSLNFFVFIAISFLLINLFIKILFGQRWLLRNDMKRFSGGGMGVIMVFIFGTIIGTIFIGELIMIILFLFFLMLVLTSVILIGSIAFNHKIKSRAKFNGYINLRATISLLMIVLVIFSSSGYLIFYHANFVAPIQQAEYFDTLITIETNDFFFNEIADDQIRLINPDLALTLIKKHTSVFGSNIIPISLHITTRNNKLIWVAAMAPDNLFNQKLNGLLILDASNPNAEPEKIELNDAVVAEGLFYDAQSQYVSWKLNPMQRNGRVYITWIPNDYLHSNLKSGDLVQIQTFYIPLALNYQTRFGGVKIFNMQGDLLETFTDRELIPSWVAQSFDEDWLEENIWNWGNLKRGDGFDIFAGGFLGLTTPSTNRLEISMDTRYILSPDTNLTVGITPVHPISNELSNAGVFVSNATHIIYYDYSQRNYISSKAVEQFVESNEPPASQGEYYGTLPMLYPVKVGNTTRLAWFTPLYHKTYAYNDFDELEIENVQFRGLYVIDAKDINKFSKVYMKDFNSASDMVKEAKIIYREKFGINESQIPEPSETYIIANVTQKSSWVEDGTSYIALKTNNTQYKYLIASPKVLSTSEWLLVLFDINIGSIIKFKVYKINDQWMLISIDELI